MCLAQFVKCCQTFLILNGLHNRSSGKDEERRCLVFTFSKKVKLNSFTSQSCNDCKEMYKKTVMHAQSSLRSKRFQSSYSARVGAGAKKMEGGGGGEKRKPSLPYPSPVIPLFSALVPTFATNSRGSACYAGYAQSCCFANLSLFCRSRCRLRRCCLSSPQ